MLSYLKQSTASQTRIVGPFVDDTDFKTAETGLTIANTDVKLSKNGGTSSNKNSGGGTHIANGDYAFTFDAVDTNTVGELSVSISVSGALICKAKFVVLEEAVYDGLFASGADGKLPATLATADVTGNLPADIVAVSGATNAADNLELDYDGTGYAKSNSTIGTCTTNTDMVSEPQTQAGIRAAVGLASADLDTQLSNIVTDTAEIGAAGAGLTNVPWNASWDAEVQSEVQDAIEANHLDHLLAVAYDATSKPGASDALLNEMVEDDSGVTRYTVNALENGPSGSGASAAAIADAVWDEARSGHTTAGTFGLYLDAQVSTVGGGSLTEAGIADAVWDEARSGHTTAGTFGEGVLAESLNTQAKADVNAEADAALSDYDAPTKAELDSGLAALNDLDATGVAEAVWDAVSGSYVDAGTTGNVLANILLDTADLQANQGAWATATGFSTHSAADVADAVWDEAIAGHTTSNTFGGFLDSTNTYLQGGSVADEVWDADTSNYLTTGTTGKALSDMLADTNELQGDDVPGLIAALNDPTAAAIADAVWDEAQSGHTTAGTFGLYLDQTVSSGGGGDATAATQTTIVSHLTDIKGGTWSSSTDTLEAIRDRGDAAWLTGGGGTAATVAAAVWNTMMADHTTSGTFGARLQEGNTYATTNANIKTIRKGDSYDGTANAKLSWTVTKDFTSGWTGTLVIRHRTTGSTLASASIVVVDATTLEATLTTTDTAFTALTSDQEFGPHAYDIQMVNGSSEQTPISGVAILKPW